MVVLTWFIAHYAHRAIVWPLRRTIGKTNVPVVGALFPTDAALALRFGKAPCTTMDAMGRDEVTRIISYYCETYSTNEPKSLSKVGTLIS